jgi:cell wall-associated NlpC family hydrolase
MQKNQLMADAARACLGTPFHHQGRVAGMGLDCIGLIIHAMQVAGYEVADCTDYGRQPEGEKLHDALIAHGFKTVKKIQAGDVLLFRFNGMPQHVGIALSQSSMVHAYLPIGRVVEAGLGETWLRRISNIYRREV